MTIPAGSSGRTSVRQNNFDLIRLVAASQVVLFHGLEHLGPSGVTHSVLGEALSWFPGVPIFFVVSGFLITDRMLKMFKKKAETKPQRTT